MTRPENSAATAMVLLLGDQYFSNESNRAETEVKNFLGDNRAPLDANPVNWWEANTERFPRLAELARQYLYIPGIWVPSERAFSAAGLTVNRLRTRLTPDHVDTPIFFKNKPVGFKFIVERCRESIYYFPFIQHFAYLKNEFSLVCLVSLLVLFAGAIC